MTVAFTNTSDCHYTAHTWDFGNGVTSTLPGPTHTYDAVGGYTATLTLSSTQDGCITRATQRIAVLYENILYLPVILREQ